MRALVWFRNDLRTADNPALHAACRDATRGVAAIFAMTPGQWARHDWATCKADLVVRTLRELSADLAELNISLLIGHADRFDGVPDLIAGAAGRLGCDAVYFNREPGVNEDRRDEAVAARLARDGRRAIVSEDQTLLPPGFVVTKAGSPYTVFTPFRRACLRLLAEDPPVTLPAPRRLREPIATPDPPPSVTPGAMHASTTGRTGPARPDLWPAGEREAQRRLRRFASAGLAEYHRQRDVPARPGTSLLSPYLAIGAISVRQCFAAAIDRAGGRPFDESPARTGPAVWVDELVWRDFYRCLVRAFPRLSMGRPFRHETRRVRWADDPEGLAAWERGLTGFPIVDAAMRQLAETGWMHNRCRMIVAMFLTKDLLIDWRSGERHFMRSLVDGDLPSNNGGWQWSASTGTDAAPYFRVFNPASQGRRFDQGGEFIRRFVPEIAILDDRAIHDPPPDARARLGYPAPIVDHATARLRAIAAFKALAE